MSALFEKRCVNLIEKEDEIYVCFKHHCLPRDCCMGCSDFLSYWDAEKQILEERKKQNGTEYTGRNNSSTI